MRFTREEVLQVIKHVVRAIPPRYNDLLCKLFTKPWKDGDWGKNFSKEYNAICTRRMNTVWKKCDLAFIELHLRLIRKGRLAGKKKPISAYLTA